MSVMLFIIGGLLVLFNGYLCINCVFITHNPATWTSFMEEYNKTGDNTTPEEMVYKVTKGIEYVSCVFLLLGLSLITVGCCIL